MNSFIAVVDLPSDSVLVAVLLNEKLELILIVNHEHLGHILNSYGFISSLRGSSDFVSDGINELVNEEEVGLEGNVLFRIKNFMIATLNKIGLHLHWHLNINIVNLFVRDQLYLSVELGGLVEGQKVEEVKTDD